MSFRFIRRFALKLLSRVNLGDIHIKHHITGDRIRIHSFQHKGYWYHGSNRERETLTLFRELIKPGDVVLDVGGHIGYMSLLFSQLVGDSGRVIAFEPGSNNIPYIEHNISGRSNVLLIKKAVSDKNGDATFFVENLTGQNNSLFRDYDMFHKNAGVASVRTEYFESSVPTTTLDAFLSESKVCPDFIKMDIEGAEILALRGMCECLRTHRPRMMIEVTRAHQEIFELLTKCQYAPFLPSKTRVTHVEQLEANRMWNVFCIPLESPSMELFGYSGSPVD